VNRSLSVIDDGGTGWHPSSPAAFSVFSATPPTASVEQSAAIVSAARLGERRIRFVNWIAAASVEWSKEDIERRIADVLICVVHLLNAL
jgi:hypothetical protein